MPGATLVHDNLDAGILADERSACAGVVQVNMGHQQHAHIGDLDARGFKPPLKHRNRRAGTRIHYGYAVIRFQQGCGDHAGTTQVLQIDETDSIGDFFQDFS